MFTGRENLSSALLVCYHLQKKKKKSIATHIIFQEKIHKKTVTLRVEEP